jgi:CRP-like cAMP-binding protein
MEFDTHFGRLLDLYLRREPRRSIPVDVRRKENLYMLGDTDEYVYLLVHGHVKSVTYTPTGKGCLLDLYSRLDIVGESCLLFPTRRETTTAMCEVQARKIPRKWFLELLSAEGLFESYLCYLAERIAEHQEQITRLVTYDSEHRLAATLLRLARRSGAVSTDWVYLDQRITREELAAMVGTTRSRVGHFLKLLRQRQLVEESGSGLLRVRPDQLSEFFGFAGERPDRVLRAG